jgi:Phage integrase, N-terminal SAM-like domain
MVGVKDKLVTAEIVPVGGSGSDLPPILAGRHTQAVSAQVRRFYLSVGDIFERWVARRSSKHTQRAYRQDVMDFVLFMGLKWPDDATRLFTVSVADVLAFRDQMLAENKAPKTINRRIASLSSFYKYLQGVASEFRRREKGPSLILAVTGPSRREKGPSRREKGPSLILAVTGASTKLPGCHERDNRDRQSVALHPETSRPAVHGGTGTSGVRPRQRGRRGRESFPRLSERQLLSSARTMSPRPTHVT